MQLCKGKLVLTALCNHFLRHAFSWVLFNSGMSNSFYIVGHFEKELQFQQYISFFVLFVLHDKEIDFFFFFSSLCRLSCNHKLEDLLFKKKKSQISQFIVEKTDFCLFLFFLIVYLLHIYFGVVSMVTGELLSVENVLKPAKIHLKSLHFLKPSPGPDWRLHRANSGPRALCLIPLVQF